jgi:hypothetical protein
MVRYSALYVAVQQTDAGMCSAHVTHPMTMPQPYHALQHDKKLISFGTLMTQAKVIK